VISNSFLSPEKVGKNTSRFPLIERDWENLRDFTYKNASASGARIP
jgi:hypothetical protein